MRRRLEGIGVVAAPTFRSRAYLQTFESLNLEPEVVLYLDAAEDQWSGAEVLELPLVSGKEPFVFRPGETARETASKNGWHTIEAGSDDINSEEVVRLIDDLDIEILIYSGMPRGLLRQPLLETGKRFLHIHGGYVPAYRAATGFYFGLLEQGGLGVSALWLDAGVDTGPIVAREWYPPIPGMDIDFVMDPAVRADLLGELMLHRLAHGDLPSMSQEGPSESFFVIHPVLKHLALRRAGIVDMAAKVQGDANV